MKHLLLGLLGSLIFSTAAIGDELHFGTPVDKNTEVAISSILAAPQEYLDKSVTVAGTIVGVCKKRGCWMTLAAEETQGMLRLKVKDGDMVFPVSAKGRHALATGRLVKVDMDLKHTRKHMKQLAKARGESFDPASVTEGMSLYQVVPVGVTILDKKA